MDTNISVIQLIKSGKINIQNEVNNVNSGKDISINIKTYFEKTNQYKKIIKHLEETNAKFIKPIDEQERKCLSEKKLSLLKIKNDFVINTLHLADTLSKLNPSSERLLKAIILFEEGEIEEADEILNETELLNDQHNLIIFIEYQEHKLKNYGNEFKHLFN